MTDEASTPVERTDAALDDALETAAEAQEEIAEEIEDAADTVEETAENAAEDIEEAIEEAAEEVAQATGLTEESARALIREELDARLGPPETAAVEPTVTVTETETVIEPTEDEPAAEVGPDTAPVTSGSFAARYLHGKR